MELAQKDRRTAKRYALDLPCIYRLFGRDRSVQEGHGHTRNMSSHGLLVTAGEKLATGQAVEIFIQLPRAVGDTTTTQLIVLGHVVRSDIDEAGVRIVRHGFLRTEAAQTASVQ